MYQKMYITKRRKKGWWQVFVQPFIFEIFKVMNLIQIFGKIDWKIFTFEISYVRPIIRVPLLSNCHFSEIQQINSGADGIFHSVLFATNMIWIKIEHIINLELCSWTHQLSRYCSNLFFFVFCFCSSKAEHLPKCNINF